MVLILIGCTHLNSKRVPASLDADQKAKSNIKFGDENTFFRYCTPDNLASIDENNKKIIDYLVELDGDNELHMSTFLNKLPKGIFNKVTSLISSKSLQGASFHGPRFILFGNKNKYSYGQDQRIGPNSTGTIMSINMDVKERGYNNIEFMLWSDKNKVFNFVDVEFNSDFKNPKVTVNPAKCTACHTAYRKPNWDSYNFWANSIPVVGESFNFKIEKEAVETITKKIDEGVDFKWKFIKSIDPVSIFFYKKYSEEVLLNPDEIKANGPELHDNLQGLNKCRRENIIFNLDKNKKLVQKLVGYLNYCLKNEYQNFEVKWQPNDFLTDEMIFHHDEYFKKLLNLKNIDVPRNVFEKLVELNKAGLRRRSMDFKEILEKNGYNYNTVIDNLLNSQNKFGGEKSKNSESLPSELKPIGQPPEGSIKSTLIEFSFLWYVLGPIGLNLDHWSLSIDPSEKTFGDDTAVISNEILKNIFPYKNGFCSNAKSYIASEVEKIGIENLYDKVKQTINEYHNLPAFEKFLIDHSGDAKVQSFLKSGKNSYAIKIQYLKWSEMSIKKAIDYGVF